MYDDLLHALGHAILRKLGLKRVVSYERIRP